MGEEYEILMVGMGAIGGTTAGFIKKHGYKIESICKYEDLTQKVQTEGIEVLGVRGEFQIAMPAVSSISELKTPKDIIFLAKVFDGSLPLFITLSRISRSVTKPIGSSFFDTITAPISEITIFCTISNIDSSGLETTSAFLIADLT